MAAQPIGAGRIRPLGEAGGQSDAVALDVAAGVGVGDAGPQERHRSDMATDRLLDLRFLSRKAPPWSMPVEPGSKQPGS